MLETKKIPDLSSSPLNHPRVNGLLGVASEKTIDDCRIHRFNIDLFRYDDQKCPEYNYQTLLKQVNKQHNSETSIGLDNDETDELKALAKKFEDKYGGPSKKSNKKKKVDDFIDIGYGYDEDDTFIDNSEAYDEVVPSDWTTEHGGFYVNQGNLDYRPLSIEKDANKSIQLSAKKKKKKKILDEKKLSKTPKELSTHKKKKQFLNKEKQRKRQESLLKAQKILSKKNKKKNSTIIDDSSQDGLPLAQLNKSYEDDVPLSKIRKSSNDETIKTEKCSPVDDNVPLAKIITTFASSNANAILAGKPATSSTATGNVTPVLTPSTVCSTGTLNTPVESMKTTPVKVESPLPEGLSDDLLNDINQLKQFSEVSVKGKFFNAEVNKVLLSFARKCRKQSPKLRNAVYDHILFYLPCAKDTLVKRCRTLVVQHQRDLEDEPMRLLKQEIDASMPDQKKAYDDEVAKALQEQAREQIKQTGVDPTKPGDETAVNSEDKNKKNFPKRKYTWSDEVRKLLCDVISVRVGLFKMSKSKSMTAEEYIKDFLESEIRKMWPKGWMTSRILYRESRAAHQEITLPLIKGKKAGKKTSDDISDSPKTVPPVTQVVTSTKGSATAQTLVNTPSVFTNIKFSTPTSTSLIATGSAKVTQTGVKKELTAPRFVNTSVYAMINKSSLASVSKANSQAFATPATDIVTCLPQHLKIVSHSSPLNSANTKFITTMDAFLSAHSKQKVKPTLVKVHTPNNLTRPTSSANVAIVTSTPHKTPLNTPTSLLQPSPKVSPFLNTPTFLDKAKVDHFIKNVKIHEGSKAVKRKTPNNAELSTASKRPVASVLDYALSPPKSIEERSWSEMENDLVRISHQASINRFSKENLTELITAQPSSTGKLQCAQQKKWQPSNQYISTPVMHQSLSNKNTARITQSSNSIVNKTPSSSSMNSTNGNPSLFAPRTSPVHQHIHQVQRNSPPRPSLHHVPRVASSHHTVSHEPSAKYTTMQQPLMHPSPNKSSNQQARAVSTTPMQSYLRNPQSSAHTEKKTLDFYVPQHPAARLHQANESGARQFSARFIQGNQLKVEQQAGLHTSSHSTSNLHSIHPSIKLMEGLSRSSLVSASGNNTVLDHHALHPAHALHGNQNRVGGFPTGMTGLVEQHQQRLTVEQQIDLLQQEALKRSEVTEQKRYNFGQHFS